ncbi:hypothetical protein [Caballeronia sordidicola]|uniref:hypothetical protein n=1 Tax=Caballeronia sordidicola TaxID=196367 RepID=UPI00117D3E18|nr:hypothetical protein [Caballeronia sordidicola]
MGMGASLYRAIGAIIGVGTGLSILALEAVRVRRAFNLMALSRLREILDVENVSRDLADEANAAICGIQGPKIYFEQVCNWSKIEHALRNIEEFELGLTSKRTHCAVVEARRHVLAFFSLLRVAASEFRQTQEISACVVNRLSTSFHDLLNSVDYVENECQRQERK